MKPYVHICVLHLFLPSTHPPKIYPSSLFYLTTLRLSLSSHLVSSFLDSVVINADQIAFVKDGAIAEIGTHESLMAKKGYYHGLMGIQMSGYDEAGMNI